MSLKEQFKDFIDFAHCESKIIIYDGIVERLKTSKLKNIAVLGETNCGKTSLINRLSGKEVRPATKLSLGEKPLMVTFGSEETKEGFEKVDVETFDKNQGIALYEIPINIAIDYDNNVCSHVLETMDAVIYVVSAIMPFTASDVENLKVISNKFPLIIYISKTDLLDGSNEYNDCIEYVKKEFKNAFNDVYCEFYDGKTADYEKGIIQSVNSLSLDEIREFHIAQVEYAAKNIIVQKLNEMLDEVSKQREERSAEIRKAESLSRDKSLEWNDIRLAMLEKKQETIDYADKKISFSKISAKQSLATLLNDSKNKKDWVNRDLKPILENIINETANNVAYDMCDIVNSHVSWLISEVNRRFDKKISIEDMRSNVLNVDGIVNPYEEVPDRKKTIMAVGSGIVAGGAIISSIPLITTLIIVVPASLLTFAFIKGSIDEIEKYNEKITRFVEKCCEDNFNKLSNQLHSDINSYYEMIVSEIISLSKESACAVNFDDIREAESSIKNKILELNNI